MSINTSSTAEPALEIDLRDPSLAALLGLAVARGRAPLPAAVRQGRLFMICILGTYFFGLALGEGKVVYASWNQVDRRWQYPLQLGVGLPALPAIVQSMVVRRGNDRSLAA